MGDYGIREKNMGEICELGKNMGIALNSLKML